ARVGEVLCELRVQQLVRHHGPLLDADGAECEQRRRAGDDPPECDPVRLQRSTTSAPGAFAGSSVRSTSLAHSRVFQAGTGVEHSSRGTKRERFTRRYSWMWRGHSGKTGVASTRVTN